MQGACKGPPSPSLLKLAESAGRTPAKVDLAEFREGQCVVTLGWALAYEDGAATAGSLWLDNLFLVYRLQRDRPLLQIRVPFVYITNSTLQADGEMSLGADSAFLQGVCFV